MFIILSAKYALAIVARAQDLLGDRQLIGYDIGCTFNGTILNSSLGEIFERGASRCCVNVFHGYSHSHSCQTVNHPSVIPGAGNNDLEGMERIFSGSNELAPVTRYSTKYHRRMHIDRYFTQWDADRYANLAKTLLTNYRHALDVLATNVPEVEEWLERNGRRADDLERWEQDEAEYFARAGKVTQADRYAVEYVIRLREYWDLE